ncbi:MAG: N-acetylmuramoyl-L-alanine amidase [Clostridia bacterium]|nr:N-acetylmuramoyl-L-alanine amidase [Clostridia bacterium]
MAKHAVRPRWWMWVILSVAAVLAVAAILAVCLLWPDPPAEDTEISADTAVTTTVTTTDTTTTTESSTTATEDTTVPFTTTTAAPKVTLTVTSHSQKTVTTTEPITTFTGTSDPRYPLTINGKEVKRDKTGAFSVEFILEPGKNTFTFSHKGKQTDYTVNYRYVIMQSYTPSGSRSYQGGSSFAVVVSAREGSTVTATFRGKTITLRPATGQGGDGDKPTSETFIDYSGTFSLPESTADKDYGAVTFKATYGGQTDTGRSGTIRGLKTKQRLVGEIVSFSAETFDGDKNDDDSRPTNNYFPKGTKDYVVGRSYFGDKEYLLLRCGRRVYVDKELSPPKQTVTVTKEYAGTLPATNKLSVAQLEVTAKATYLTLNTNWKAPFFLDLLPQKYYNPSTQDYRVTDVTCEYVEITFCYATAVSGDLTIPKNHPLFTKATVKRQGGDTVMRLYLRNKGGFYGWDAYYNEDGQLVFYFLHPAQVLSADNGYGANLKGVTILLDVGHGYKSSGASGLDSDHPEGERNYYLATLIKRELESIGATVILNRTAKQDMDADTRCQHLKKVKPDLCIAIHHDANASSKPNGFGSFYSTPFSYDAAKAIYNATMAANIYNKNASNNRNRLQWHYYFMARMSDCPVVLTENGFMSSPLDHTGIVSDYTNWQKAQAITKGVAKYFLSLRLDGYAPPDKTTIIVTGTTTTTTDTTATLPPTTEDTTTATEESTTTDTTPAEDTTTGSGQDSQTNITIP